MEQRGRRHLANITGGAARCKARFGDGTFIFRSAHRQLSDRGSRGAFGWTSSNDRSIIAASASPAPPNGLSWTSAACFRRCRNDGCEPARKPHHRDRSRSRSTAAASSEWTTVINPLTRRQERAPSCRTGSPTRCGSPPRGSRISRPTSPARLAGRLLIAHNARFDYGFLKAEFGRVGIEFHPDVLCSLMLSRRLYAQLAHHDLDSLIEHHALEAEVRHRALHDARLIWQFWQLDPSRTSPRGDRERHRSRCGPVRCCPPICIRR